MRGRERERCERVSASGGESEGREGEGRVGWGGVEYPQFCYYLLEFGWLWCGEGVGSAL